MRCLPPESPCTSQTRRQQSFSPLSCRGGCSGNTGFEPGPFSGRFSTGPSRSCWVVNKDYSVPTFPCTNTGLIENLPKVEVDDFFGRMMSNAPGVRDALPRRGDSQEAIELCVACAREELDKNFDDPGPIPSVRLDAFLRVRALVLLRRMRTKDTYNPHKRMNDSFDQDLLKYLAFPTALCTGDGPLIAAVEAARSWQGAWIVRPEELANPEVVERVAELAWPEARERQR